MAAETFTLLTLDDQAAPSFNELLGIDDAGVAVGYFGNGVSPNPFPTALALSIPYTAAQYRTLATGSYTVSGASTEAQGINNLGVVVGSGSTIVGAAATGLLLGTVTAPATATAGGFARVLGVNDQGDKVGYAQSGTVVGALVSIQGGGTTTLTALPVTALQGTGGAATIHALQATGIDNADIITGFGTVTGGATEGFVYNKATGTVLALTGPAGGSFTEALGLNNEGQVVGTYADSTGALNGFVYDMATATYTTVDATQSAASTVPASSTVIEGINDLGEIVGYDTTADGATHGLFGYVPGSAVNIDNPTAGSTIDVAPGMRLLSLGGSNAVTLVEPGVGGAVLFANTGADTIDAFGAADTVVAGTGADVITATGSNDVVFLGAAPGTVVATASGIVVAGAASGSIRDFGGGLVFAGSGNVTVTGAAASSAAASTIIGGTGSLVASAGDAAGAVVFAATGSSTIAGGAGRASLVGGGGPATIYAGSGGGLIWGGTSTGTYAGDTATGAAATLIVAGAGASTVYAAAGDTVVLTGSSSAFVADLGSTTLAGGATLVASGSSGSDTFQLGASADLIFAGAGSTDFAFDGKGASTIVGGSGQDIYNFASLPGGGGAYTVFDFKQGTDAIALGGYAANEARSDLANASFARGNTRLTLGDKTQITFVGIHLTIGDFG